MLVVSSVATDLTRRSCAGGVQVRHMLTQWDSNSRWQKSEWPEVVERPGCGKLRQKDRLANRGSGRQARHCTFLVMEGCRSRCLAKEGVRRCTGRRPSALRASARCFVSWGFCGLAQTGLQRQQVGHAG